MNKLILFLSALTVGLSLASPALAGQDRGGGDDIGLEFQAHFLRSLNELRTKNPGLWQKLTEANVSETFLRAKVLVVDHPLTVSLNGVQQASVAVNDRNQATVELNRTRWKGIKNPRIKDGIALHETLSLAGLESTGSYPISSQYVALFGLSPKVILTGGAEYESVFAEDERKRAREVADWCADIRRRTQSILNEVRSELNSIKAEINEPGWRDRISANLGTQEGGEQYRRAYEAVMLRIQLAWEKAGNVRVCHRDGSRAYEAGRTAENDATKVTELFACKLQGAWCNR